MSKFRLSVYLLTIILVIAVGVLGTGYWRLYKAAEATGAFPYQVGLTAAVISPCFPTPAGGACVAMGDVSGTAACNTKGPATCATYTYVSGVPAGGMGISVLLPDVVVTAIGLVSGASYIGGGMSPVLMETGISASIGGAYPPGVASLPGKSFPGLATMMKKAFEEAVFSIAGEKR